jgi:K+-transporting ATPase c subunit
MDVLFKWAVPRPSRLKESANHMAVIGKNIYGVKSKKDEAVEIDQQLARLEDDIRKLKIDFDIYFNGGSKRPPLEARARLESVIKRIADNRNLSYAQRYYYNTLVARFTSYRELWRRTLKAKGQEIV